MKLRRRLSPGAWLVRGLGWVVLVPALVFALVVQFVPGPARVVRDLTRGPEAAIGPPKRPCSEVRSPRQQPTAGYSDPDGTLRVFAIQYTLDFEDVRDYATWRRTLECLMEDLVQPYRKQGQPTLVVFPEDMGLPTVAMGVRGATARAQSGSVASAASEAVPLGLGAALGQLNLAYSTQIAAYQARFGPIDPRKQLFVAATDTFARAVNVTFSDIAKQYGVYVVVSNNQATYRETHNPVEVALFSDPSVRTDVAYVATSSRVTNSTFLWGPDDVDRSAPDGMKNLLFRNEKVPLTALEKDLIGLDEGPRSGPAARANAGGPQIAGFKVGLATSLPAFAYGYPYGKRPKGFKPCADTVVSFAACQDAQGVTLQIQADANPGRWAATTLAGNWQPLEWMSSVWRAVTDPTVNFKYDVTPMMNGNLMDLVFDGQSTISARGAKVAPMMFVGNDQLGPDDAADMGVYVGRKPEFLAMTPWSGGSGNDRAELEGEAAALAPHGARAGEYTQTAVFADLVP